MAECFFILKNDNDNIKSCLISGWNLVLRRIFFNSKAHLIFFSRQRIGCKKFILSRRRWQNLSGLFRWSRVFNINSFCFRCWIVHFAGNSKQLSKTYLFITNPWCEIHFSISTRFFCPCQFFFSANHHIILIQKITIFKFFLSIRVFCCACFHLDPVTSRVARDQKKFREHFCKFREHFWMVCILLLIRNVGILLLESQCWCISGLFSPSQLKDFFPGISTDSMHKFISSYFLLFDQCIQFWHPVTSLFSDSDE